MKVLIVDDDAVDRQIIKRALQISGVTHVLQEAKTVAEGMRKFNEGEFDLVLVDFRMPGEDGVELVMSIHEGGKTKKSAVVMMSSSEDEVVALECIRAGAHDYIPKAEITASRLRRSILHAHARFDLESQLSATHEKLKHLAERDKLTGLANRYLFDESLKVSIANNRREEHKLALLLIDLDNFKFVNDNFGHDVGDMLLQRVVQRIHSCLRGNEMFARLGGDEFSITLSNLHDAQEASKVARRILLVLEKPFDINGRTIVSGASIGIAVHPDNGNEPETLLKSADIAMYRAKKLGRHRACFFEQEMQAQFSSRYEVEQELRQALEQQQFSLVYQPIYAAQSHQLGGFEALLHWQDERGVHATRSYLAVAEETKLILQIGRWAIEQALIQQVQWANRLPHTPQMHINLSPAQCTDSALISMLAEFIQKHKVRAEHIVFDITEHALAGRGADAKRVIGELKTLGCRVALDDFGAGSSSIANLRNFSFDLIKLDPSFLPSSKSSEQDTRLFSSVVSLIHALDLRTVVIGTETVEQIELCCKLGVDQLQGHFFSRPEPVSFIEENLLAREPIIATK